MAKIYEKIKDDKYKVTDTIEVEQEYNLSNLEKRKIRIETELAMVKDLIKEFKKLT